MRPDFANSIPDHWYRAAVTLAAGDTVDAFIARLQESLSGTWMGAWAWSGSQGSLGAAVVLATPNASQLTALLAHGLAVAQSLSKQEAWLRASQIVVGLMRMPEEEPVSILHRPVAA
jgi:hypothetical protein